MSESTAFSTSAEDAITRTIDISAPPPSQTLSAAEFEAYYEIPRTVREIVDNDYKRTALQFPDELLHDSVPIYRALKAEIGDRELYILADTTYGSCCVDDVAAQHVDADAIVHYGHACLSAHPSVPVIYIFGHRPLDIAHCVAACAPLFAPSSVEANAMAPRSLRLRYEVGYAYAADELVAGLRSALEPHGVTIYHTPVPLKTIPHPPMAAADLSPSPGENPGDDIEGSTEPILWIGPDSLALTNLLLTSFTSPLPVHTYNPDTRTAQPESPHTPTSRLLKKRYAALSRARSCDVFGILISSPSPAQLPLIRHIRARIRACRKKSYTVSVGKVNPAKLGNFAEVECWVLVACGENSLVDGKEFMRPVITPFELELALSPTPEWTGRYVLDLGTVLKEGQAKANNATEKEKDGDAGGGSESDDERPVFSPITGTYRQRKLFSPSGPSASHVDPGSTDVILRNQDNAVSTIGSAAADFLAGRTYQGLERRAGMDPPSLLEQGRSGIARGYKDDHR
ncbi:diphthamide biosynthesis protein [Athelia psychrophila]|uniref:2-(3-amino-3-carboxypropyl)histidine synthase subunit 2 n=1 Tax=Athelia psychrophila TaxID=1759441 RepID=A0A166M3B2_9AGAM|nr:diphthamide biosynthesis protein [Fibularhizoctonia sp. CBS 109695]